MTSTNASPSPLRTLGEIIAVVGVVLSLVFVAAEVRQNTLAARAQARQELAAQNWDFLLRIAEDDELAALWAEEWTVEFIEGLPPDDRYKAVISAVALLTRLEGVYLQTEEGLIGDEALDYYGMNQPLFDQEGFWMVWSRIRNTFNPEFRDFFEEHHGREPAPGSSAPGG